MSKKQDSKRREGGQRGGAGVARPRRSNPPVRSLGERLVRTAATGRRQIAENPLAAVAGAAALSAGLALLLPASRREAEVMGEVAGKLEDIARDAADTAVEAGKSEVGNLAQSALASVGGAVVGAAMARAETGDATR